MLRCVFHDRAPRIYAALCRVAEKDKTVPAFMQEYIDRTEGRPTKKIERTETRRSYFIFTTKDGEEIPALPERVPVGKGSTPDVVTAEDRIVLGAEQLLPL